MNQNHQILVLALCSWSFCACDRTDSSGPDAASTSRSAPDGEDEASTGDVTEPGRETTEGSSGEVAPDDLDTRLAKAGPAACEALGGGIRPLPEDEDFSFGGFPAVFEADFSTAQYSIYQDLGEPGEYWCHLIRGVDEDWSPLGPNSFLDEDGEIRKFVVTSGIDDVIFYGSDETGVGSPGAPRTFGRATPTDACTEFTRVWIPNPAESPSNASRMCMRHESPLATIAFVRVEG